MSYVHPNGSLNPEYEFQTSVESFDNKDNEDTDVSKNKDGDGLGDELEVLGLDYEQNIIQEQGIQQRSTNKIK